MNFGPNLHNMKKQIRVRGYFKMADNQTTDIVRANTGKATDQIDSLRNGSGVFSTIVGTDFAAKVSTLNAMTNAVPLADHLGETINLTNVVVQATTIIDDVTHEENEALRIVLIDKDGNSFAAISNGIFKSLQNIFGILGMPDQWTEPLPIVVTEMKGRRGFRFMTVRIA